EENVLGSGPSTFVDPGAGNRQSRSMYAYHTEVSGTIRHNLIGFAETTAFPMTWSAKDLLIEGNEIRGAVTAGLAITYAGSEISGDITARGNLIDGNGDAGLTMYGSYGSNVVENNTITNNGATYLGPGVNVWGVGNSLTRNIVTGNDAAGVVVAGQRPITAPTWSASNSNEISENLFGGNGGLAIDLVESSDDANDHWVGDGITLTAGTDTNTGNNGLDAPVIASATEVSVSGTACASCDVQLFRAASGAGDGGRGEGIEYLGSTVADGLGNWSLAGVTTGRGGEYVSAIAIDGSKDTSEFGANVVVIGDFVVNSTGDQADIVPGDGKCYAGVLNSQGQEACTLRAAVMEANAFAGVNIVAFNIPVSEPGYNGAGAYWSIQPSGGLPWVINEAVTIDGYSQPGAQANSVASPGASDAVLKVEVNGASAGGSSFLSVLGDNSEIRGLAINGFNFGIAVQGNDNTIAGNYIGTDVTGMASVPNTLGLQLVNGANGNTFGGTDPADRNLVSGNTTDGIRLNTSTTNGNTIAGNYLGTDVTGAAPLPNGETGVEIAGPFNNTIGGTTPGARNIISSTFGVLIIGLTVDFGLHFGMTY
ncbi:MAG: hypothetical protein GY778_08490, partial [bacterium]|nr:hypothetical protein [bacterium]